MANQVDYERIQRRLTSCKKLIEQAKAKRFAGQEWTDEEIKTVKKLFATNNVDEAAKELDKILEKKKGFPMEALFRKKEKKQRGKALKANIKKLHSWTKSRLI